MDSMFMFICIILRSSIGSDHLFYQTDLCFMASRVISGEAKAVVVRTGDKTFWGYLCAYKRKDSIIFSVSYKHVEVQVYINNRRRET